SRRQVAAIPGRGPRRFYRSRVHLARVSRMAGRLKRLAAIIEAFRVVRPSFEIRFELLQRVMGTAGIQQGAPVLPQDLAQIVLGILLEDNAELPQRIIGTALLACDASQLKMRVGFAVID